MEVLGDARTSLRSFLLQAAATCGNEVDRVALEAAVQNGQGPELRRLLHETVVYHYYKAAPAYPKIPWSTARSLQLTEVIALVIERLLTRRRADPTDSNLLTLGYREVAPGSHGHRVATTNAVMCYFPNTLVATLKGAVWESLHALIGDDLLVHLLLNYCIFVKVAKPSGSYVQVAGTSLRWMKRPAESLVGGLESQHQKKKMKQSGVQTPGRPHAADATLPMTASINHVMYARHFQKRNLFAKSELLLSGRANDSAVSRGNASKLICSIFPDAKHEKRLPKRLVNLVPIIQELLQRVRTTDVDGIISKMLPTPPELRAFLRDHRYVRDVIIAVNAKAKNVSRMNSPTSTRSEDRRLDPLMCRIADEGYMSQSESPISRENLKRKRREDAVASLSNNSTAATRVRKVEKKVRFKKEETSVQDEIERQVGVTELSQLQRHRDEISSLLQMTISAKRARRVVQKVLSVILPKSLFGKPSADRRKQESNWFKLKAFIDRLVTSRKYDILSIQRLAASFRVKDIEWMDASGKSSCPPNELQARQLLVSQILTWVTSEVVYPILRNCFYITEGEGSANDVFYYSRPVWTIISNLALYDLTSQILKPTTRTETNLVSRQLGASRLRLLPKINGIRPLMNLSGKAVDSNASVNRSLELVHRALLFEIDRQSHRLLGATVRNVDEIHAKLKTLSRSIKGCQCCSRTPARKLYCVAVDVERCFDTIRPKKLLRILKKVFAEEEYLVRKHWVCKGAYYKMERPAFASGELKGYDQLVGDVGKKNNAVFVDGVLYDYIGKAKILALLREHLTANTVQAGDEMYVQRQGIPQGSVLSTSLCNLYYAHFEKRVLHKHIESVPSSLTEDLTCSHELLMRYTDDFLFVSTDLEKARGFVELMHRGNEEYGCFVNPHKSRANFPVITVDAEGAMREIPRFDEPSYHESTDTANGSFLAWCGILLDPTSMQVYVNYDKLSLFVVAASIPMDTSKKIGTVFVNKVISAVRQRWHRLYFDPELLHPCTIQVNVYQMVCLAALRFVLLVDKLPITSSVSFLHDCVHKIILKMSRGIQRTLSERGKHQHTELDRKVWQIGLHGFFVVIGSTKLPIHPSSHRADASKQLSLWRALLNDIQQGRKRIEASGRPYNVSINTQTTSTVNVLTLEELERDPRNAIVERWLAAFRTHAREKMTLVHALHDQRSTTL